MKKNMWRKSIVSLLAICLASYSFGQTSAITLRIGDPAPELKVTWLKGTPVDSIAKDKIYVVEFWATWCGPCKAAMPHLSELAKQYEGKVTFIGVDVWEKGSESKTYDTFTPMLKEFVASMGDKMAYNIAMDNNDMHMANKWMKASGQGGIPATFLIKDGKIIWMGHPIKLDKILEEVLAGTYDMASTAKSFNEETEKMQNKMAPYMALNKAVADAVAAKDFSTALNAIDNAMVTIDPMFKLPVYLLKFTTYLEYDVPQALAFAKDWTKETPSVKLVIADAITKKDGLPKEAYQFAVESFTEAVSKPGSLKPMIYHLMAQSCFKMNDLANAIANEEKAIETGNDAIAKGEFQGTINANSIKEYQEALAKYKAAQK
ncbi:MAG: TlpA disulfide reductase family protein [Bacteroidales bacterium]